LVGKIIGILFKLLGFGLAFWLLSYLLMSLTINFINDYNIFETEDHPAIVTEKVSEKSMIGRPKYFVIVDLNMDDGFYGIKNKVSKRKFNTLEVGDTIKGHYIHGKHFFTTLEIVTDSLLFICMLVSLLFFFAVLLYWPIRSYIEKREKKKEAIHKYKKKKTVKRKIIRITATPHKTKKNNVFEKILPKKIYHYLSDFTFSEVLLRGIFAIALIFTSGFVINGIQKFSPIGKTKTMAVIADPNAESEISYAVGKYPDPFIALDLRFFDQHDKEYRVIKEVTESVYRKYQTGEMVEISYITQNPYNIFVRDYTLLNLLEIIIHPKFMLLLLISFWCIIYYSIRLYVSHQKEDKF
jgi:hypothetical protein